MRRTENLPQTPPSETGITSIVERFMMNGKHALHVLALLPIRVKLFFSFWMRCTITLILLGEIRDATHPHQFEGSSEDTGSKSLQVFGGHLEAGNVQCFRSLRVKSGGRSKLRRVVHRCEVYIPVRIAPVPNASLLRVIEWDAIGQHIREGTVKYRRAPDGSLVQ